MLNTLKKYFSPKPIPQILKDMQPLKRTLSAYHLVMMGMGTAVGAGVFVFPGVCAGNHAGVSTIFAFALAALIMLLITLCYAELASIMPVSGGAYTYVYAVFGEYCAWIVASLFIASFMMASAYIANSFSEYLIPILASLDLYIPVYFQYNYGAEILLSSGETLYGICNIASVFIILFSTFVLAYSMETFKALNSAIVSLKVFVIIAFIAACIPHIDPMLWYPILPSNTGTFGEFGYSGFFKATSIAFLGYIGVDTITSTAQETKKPSRDIPLGIIITLIICVIIFSTITAVLTGVLDYRAYYESNNPLAIALEKIDIKYLGTFMNLGITIGLWTGVAMTMYAVSRVFFAVINDGLLPQGLGAVDSKTNTPKLLILAVGFTTTLISIFFDVKVLINIFTIGFIIPYIFVCAAAMLLRYQRPDLNRDFTCPYLYLVGTIAILFCFIMLSTIAIKAYYSIAIYLVCCSILYFSFIQYHSNHLR